MAANRRAPTAPVLDLREVRLAPIIVVHGPEAALGDRIVHQIRTLARQRDPGVELTEIGSADYRPGTLQAVTAPSLFEESRLVIVDGADQGGDAFVSDILEYLKMPADDAVLVVRHRGGQRNRKILDQAKRNAIPVLRCSPLKSAPARVQLVEAEAQQLGGHITRSAAQTLVSAVGSDLHEILGTIRQLAADHDGKVDQSVVDEHFAGRVDAGGFEIADALAAGNGPLALVLTRQAFGSHDPLHKEPVVIVAALIRKFRDLAKVSVPHLSSKELGMAPWQLSKVRDQARNWDQEKLGRAICLVAQADADVKGASRDPSGAVEKCIIEISRVYSGAKTARQ